jgi:hypothetical protein
MVPRADVIPERAAEGGMHPEPTVRRAAISAYSLPSLYPVFRVFGPSGWSACGYGW